MPLQRIPTLQLNMVFGLERFMAGDELTAKVLFDSSDPDIHIDSLTADICGIAKAGWINVHTDKIYEKEIMYWSQSLLLLSQSSLPLGRHHISLKVPIPDQCPSSYQSQYGNIRYEVRVRLDANSDQASSSAVFPFLVISRSFRSLLPSFLLNPIQLKDEIEFTCCTLPFGTVSLQIQLKRRVFIIGETIEPIIHIKNNSRKKLRDVTVMLIVRSEYEARSRYEHIDEKKIWDAVMDEEHCGSVSARTSESIDSCCLRIPFDALPTYTRLPFLPLNINPIISIHHLLKLTAMPGIEFVVPVLVTAEEKE